MVILVWSKVHSWAVVVLLSDMMHLAENQYAPTYADLFVQWLLMSVSYVAGGLAIACAIANAVLRTTRRWIREGRRSQRLGS